MDEEHFIDLMEEYSNFRGNLEIRISNSSISSGEEVCYIIDEFWNDELFNCFNEFNNLKKISLPKKTPNFINDIPTLIDWIKNKKKFKLISKDLICFIYKNKLKMNSLVNYYCGNKKLIIDYIDKKEDSLLLVNPIESQSENNIFFISSTIKNKIPLFRFILIKSSNIGDINNDLNNNTIIYSYNEYTKNISSNYSNFAHQNNIR